MNRCETATWGTLWPPVPPLGAPLGGLVGQGLRPSSKLSHMGFPGEQEEAPGLAPSSHTAQLHRGRGGHQADKTERKDTGPSRCGGHRGHSLGLGPSAQAQVPKPRQALLRWGRTLRQSQAFRNPSRAVGNVRSHSMHSWPATSRGDATSRHSQDLSSVTCQVGIPNFIDSR